MVEQVGGLFGDPLVGLLARGADDLLGLLLDLLADQLRVVEQLHRVAALGPLGRAAAQRPLQRRQRLVRDRRRLARSPTERRGRSSCARRCGRRGRSARPGRRARRRRSRSAAGAAQHVARGFPLAPDLLARAAVEVQLAGLDASAAATPRWRRQASAPRRWRSPGPRTAPGRARRISTARSNITEPIVVTHASAGRRRRWGASNGRILKSPVSSDRRLSGRGVPIASLDAQPVQQILVPAPVAADADPEVEVDLGAELGLERAARGGADLADLGAVPCRSGCPSGTRSRPRSRP